VAILSGLLATGQGELWLGRTTALLLVAVLLGGTFLAFFVFLGSSAVVIWPVAATIGYLLQLPRSEPIVTFDRVWIGGLVAYIALTPRTVARTPATRLLRACLLLIVLTFGMRALTTSTSISGPLRTWADAIVLPAILFIACERYCLQGANRLRRLTGALMIAGGVLAVIGIAERIWGFELATVTGGSIRFDQGIDQTRISGPYPAPEPYALSLLICLAATLYWILSRERGTRIVWPLVLAGMQLTAIGLALFRAGWIGALLVIAASIGLRPGRFGRTFAVVGLLGVLALAATSQLGQNKTVSARLNDRENIYGRLATYEQGLEIFRSAPLFGIGVNQYHPVAETRPPTTVAGVKAVSYPHSSYVGLLAEQGIVGLLPLIFLSYAVWQLLGALRRASFRDRRAALLMGTVAGAALGYLIMSLTLTMLPYGPSNAFFAAFLGGAAGYLDAVERESPTADS
jgi:O-antigen ligase